MAYRAFYRQWRPQTFNEIVGQDHVARTLKNAVKASRVAHAYLFCGPRGTGKTSTAKIFAKSLNCEVGKDGEPCNSCANCTVINDGSSVDVIEIDAASNRGIEEIRDLREKVKYAPTLGCYKVYIIDEVHMLTNEAFNALLKTLEEPPSHVIFILATTEPHKLPLTILSRCQRFDFRMIQAPDIIGRLKEVAEAESLTVGEDALSLIARAADGSLRDALSILDQCAAFSGSEIKIEDLHNVLGTVHEEMMEGLTRYIIEGDLPAALHAVDELVNHGKDLRLFAGEFAGYLRLIMLLKVSPEDKDILPPGYNIECIRELAGLFETEDLLWITDLLYQAEQDMRWSSRQRLVLEVALIKTLHGERGPQASPENISALEVRLSAVEEALGKLRRDENILVGNVPIKDRSAGRGGHGKAGDSVEVKETGEGRSSYQVSKSSKGSPGARSLGSMDSSSRSGSSGSMSTSGQPIPTGVSDLPGQSGLSGTLGSMSTPGPSGSSVQSDDSLDSSVPPGSSDSLESADLLDSRGSSDLPDPPDSPDPSGSSGSSDSPGSSGSSDLPDEEAPRPGTGELEKLQRAWSSALDKIKADSLTAYTGLKEGVPVQVQHNTVHIRFEKPFLVQVVEKSTNRGVIEKTISKLLGRQIRIICEQGAVGVGDAPPKRDALQKRAASPGRDASQKRAASPGRDASQKRAVSPKKDSPPSEIEPPGKDDPRGNTAPLGNATMREEATFLGKASSPEKAAPPRKAVTGKAVGQRPGANVKGATKSTVNHRGLFGQAIKMFKGVEIKDSRKKGDVFSNDEGKYGKNDETSSKDAGGDG